MNTNEHVLSLNDEHSLSLNERTLRAKLLVADLDSAQVNVLNDLLEALIDVVNDQEYDADHGGDIDCDSYHAGKRNGIRLVKKALQLR